MPDEKRARGEAPEVDVTSSIWVYGPLHQTPNSTKELQLVIEHYAWAVLGLKLVCSMLSSISLKEQSLAAVCYPLGAIGYMLGKCIRSSNFAANSDRWNVVCLGFLKVLLVRVSAQKIRYEALCPGHGPPASEDLNGGGCAKFPVKVYKVCVYLQDGFWWAFLIMLRRLNKVLCSLSSWVEGCSCHFDLLVRASDAAAGDEDPSSAWPTQLVDAWAHRPLRGMRCHVAASGRCRGLWLKHFMSTV